MMHKSGLLLFFSILMTPFLSAVSLGNNKEAPLLEAEDAFRLLATASEKQQMLRIEYAIAEGYYLYKHRFAFKSQSNGISLGEPKIPKGTPKHDEYFGDVETYRQQVVIEIPYTLNTKKPVATIELNAVSQGCADVGVCYPILKQTVSIPLR